MLPAVNTTNVKPRLGSQDKVTYEGELNKLDGDVSNDHLFDVYVGECIAPYVASRYHDHAFNLRRVHRR